MSEAPAEIIALLQQALTAGPAMRLAMLFGSAARAQLRADSDVDVAILPRDPDLPLAAELDLQAQLARACRRRVDLVRLDRADVPLRFQVARHGVVLVASPPAELVRFLAAAAGDYADLSPALVAAGRRFLQRVAQRDRT